MGGVQAKLGLGCVDVFLHFSLLQAYFFFKKKFRVLGKKGFGALLPRRGGNRKKKLTEAAKTCCYHLGWQKNDPH